jgi:beta-catenin-like protein 1
LFTVAAYKSARLEESTSREPTVEDEEDDSAPPNLPSDFFDAPQEDEEGGRFFGGGVTDKQAEIFDYMEEAEKEVKQETIDASWLRKKAIGFEKLINKNAEQRGKWEDEPHKYVGPTTGATVGMGMRLMKLQVHAE